MKKIELLAPAGNMDNLIAAVEAGADAVYLGGKSFGARAFSKNFTDEEIIKAINYCHLYGVKVYVTVNTLVYENEVSDFMNYIDFLHKNNVDAVLIQDLGMLDLVRKTYPNLEVHSSTQMHIHNLDGTLLMQKLGVKRVVLARETSIDEIKHIKNNSDIELEVFVHGGLCISYSGECLMSSMIGGRSGNRGECAGSCRLKYDVISDNKRINKGDYPLSTKDLNSLEYVGYLIESGVSSLKIEGRMKSKEYVYMVVSLYRKAIDSYYETGKVSINNSDLIKLKKIFNRKYTKGFLMNTSNNDIINDYRPNHMGVEIGKIIDFKKGCAFIKLTDNLYIGSGLRVIGNNDVGINVNEFYKDGKLVKEAHKNDVISIKVKENVKVGSKVVITLDSKVNKDIYELINTKNRKVKINAKFDAFIGNKVKITANDGNNEVIVFGNIVNKSINKSISKYDIELKLNKLGNSVYEYNNLKINIDDDIFIPLSEINELRRRMIEELNDKRLYKSNYYKEKYSINVPNFKREKLISVLVPNKDVYLKLDKKYDIVYSEEKIDGTILKLPRVIEKYEDTNDMVLVGEIGAFNKLKNICTDFSFNVVNSYTVAFLHSIGAYRITLSYELNDLQIKELIDVYKYRYNSNPNLELIVYGHEEVMISKFKLTEYYKKNNLLLRDRFNNSYKIIDKNNLMYIYNYKCRDIFNEKYYDFGINSLRYNYDWK